MAHGLKRIPAIKQYEVGKLTEKQFREDGRNVEHPLDGALGIIGFSRKESIVQYTLGIYSPNLFIGYDYS